MSGNPMPLPAYGAELSDASGLPAIAMTDHRVAGRGAEVELHVRNKRLAHLQKQDPDKVVVFAHGATYPGSVAFDQPMFGGVSWLDYLAMHGFDAYLFDVRGYGRSSRPPIAEPFASHRAPYARTPEASDDLGAVVDFVRQRTDGARVNLIGWSWGSALAGGFAAAHPDAVRHLMLVAPLWIIRDNPVMTLSRWLMTSLSGSAGFVGEFRAVSKHEALQRWVRGLSDKAAEQLIPRQEFDQWWQALHAIQGLPADQSQSVQAPSGVLADLIEIWGTGRATYEPERIRVPTQLIVGEWDVDTPLYMAQELFSHIQNAPYKRLEILSRGTHSMALELNRMDLYQRTLEFMEMRFI